MLLTSMPAQSLVASSDPHDDPVKAYCGEVDKHKTNQTNTNITHLHTAVMVSTNCPKDMTLQFVLNMMFLAKSSSSSPGGYSGYVEQKYCLF